MDTLNSAVADIPNFKLAKVGKGRERKRAGAGWFGIHGSGSMFGGAAGGAGAGGMSLAKLLITLAIAGSVSAGAWQMGRSFASNAPAGKPAAKKLFTDKDGPQQYADTSGVIKAENAIPNSMGYVSGSLDGMTPEERAKKAAEAEAARAAEEAAAKKAADEEAKKADAANPASSVPMDPATIASAAGAKKEGLGSGKFGKLGSSLGGGGGGGLSGGSGLSGGINRNFGGASGMTKPKGGAGSMSAFRAPTKPGYSSGGHKLAGKSGSKGFAKRQLDNAFTQTRQAMSAGKSENASAGAASAFDNNAGAGSVIDGPGVGNGAKTGTADGGANPTTASGGGPIGGSDAACSQGMAPDINGNCQTIKTNHSKDGASYQWMIDAVKVLLGILALLAVICIAFRDSGWLAEAAVAISWMIAGIGAAIAALGVMILAASGDMIMGGIITAVGAYTCASMFWPETLMVTSSIVTQAACLLVAAAVGGMASMNVKHPDIQ